MNASDITSRVFEKSGFKGYKSEEVDEFLREVAQEFSQLQRERNELERKLEVLADKIREYRKDEEALKEALLGAHRQGNLLINEANIKSEQISRDAQEKAERIISDAEIKAQKQVNSSNEYARKTIEEANLKASRIVGEANRKAEEIKRKSSAEFEAQNQIITRTVHEARQFRLKLLDSYKEQVELINQIPEILQNQFIKDIVSNSDNTNAENDEQVKENTIDTEIKLAESTLSAQEPVVESVKEEDNFEPQETDASKAEESKESIKNDNLDGEVVDKSLTQEFKEVFKANSGDDEKDAFFS